MIEVWKGIRPAVDDTAYVHDSAILIGEVSIGPRASIWPGCVLRGDEGPLVVGEETNIQDLGVLHNTGGQSTTYVGPRCTVGHRVVLHGCHIESDALIGMGSVLLDNCHIEPWCIVGAGAVVPAGMRVPSRSMVLGVPGRIVGNLNERHIEAIRRGHRDYLRRAVEHAATRC